MTLAERSEVVAIVWPGTANITDLLNRCALVADVEAGEPVRTLPPKEREAIAAAVEKVRRSRSRE